MQSCISVSEREKRTVSVASAETDGLARANVGGLNVSYLVYSPDRWPLEDFFSRLTSGDVVAALKKMDVMYHPSNADNEALEHLLDDGYVPVYLRLDNQTKQPLAFSENSFRLALGGRRSTDALPAAELPKRLEKFNVAAVGANVYNTAVVVVVFALFVVAAAGSRSSNNLNFASPRTAHGTTGEGRIYNRTEKVTEIDYKHLLISEDKLEPGAARVGLLFFKPESDVDWDAVKIVPSRKSAKLNAQAG